MAAPGVAGAVLVRMDISRVLIEPCVLAVELGVRHVVRAAGLCVLFGVAAVGGFG